MGRGIYGTSMNQSGTQFSPVSREITADSVDLFMWTLRYGVSWVSPDLTRHFPFPHGHAALKLTWRIPPSPPVDG